MAKCRLDTEPSAVPQDMKREDIMGKNEPTASLTLHKTVEYCNEKTFQKDASLV